LLWGVMKMVKCQKCHREVPEEETHQHLGETLCDDCYIDAMSPAKPCDPWAVYAATRTRQGAGLVGIQGLTPLQKDICRFIEDRGKATPAEVMARFNVSQGELERVVATLRHCELVRGEKEGDTVYLVPF
jgi:NAD-dependent SIR2 family protein deacetylase